MEIKKENLVNAYMAGDNSIKEMLRAMFPDIEFEADNGDENRPVTERIKTFEDAVKELGTDNPLYYAYENAQAIFEQNGNDYNLLAYTKLRIITAALNEGWQPKFTQDEWRWYPWFTLWTEEELSEKSDEWKADRHLISTGDYSGNYAGFVFASSDNAPSDANAFFGSRLCFKSEALATYCGKQFISLWADFNLIRR